MDANARHPPGCNITSLTENGEQHEMINLKPAPPEIAGVPYDEGNHWFPLSKAGYY